MVTTDRHTIRFHRPLVRRRLVCRRRLPILDGHKNVFVIGVCGPIAATNTFNDAEGAFVANVDGPVRAIRSYRRCG